MAIAGIDFSPPTGVRRACSRGVALREAGFGGDGIRPATVAWARRIARGDAVSPEKVRKMSAWFARHGASVEEARARREDKTSPAWVAWLLWGGDPGRAWSRKLVRQMDAKNRQKMARALVALAGAGASDKTSPWNVLAYATDLRGRGVALAKSDFVECVANFKRWGREVPVVLFHADTDAASHPDSRKAHAWITELRVGSMTRDGAAVATLEGRFRWVNETTRASVETGALAYGSVTLVQNGTDEETGESVGSFLWSFSLTNNPALVDLPAIAAERYWGPMATRDDALAMLRAVLGLPVVATVDEIRAEVRKLAELVAAEEVPVGIDLEDVIEDLRESIKLPVLTSAADVVAAALALIDPSPAPAGADSSASSALPTLSGRAPASPMENIMQNTFMTLAARLGIATASEDDAQRQVVARAEETGALRRQLGLPVDATAKDVETRIAALSAEGAQVPALRAELEALRAVETERRKREVAEHIESLCATDPVMAKTRAALEAFAASDYKAFAAAYPKPSTRTAATVAALTSRVTGSGSEQPSTVVPLRHNDAAAKLARELMAKDNNLTFDVALSQASRSIKKGA